MALALRDLPQESPNISLRTLDDIVVVATIHHADAWKVNATTAYRKVRLDGERKSAIKRNILLPQLSGDKSWYNFGRSRADGNMTAGIDVYLPYAQTAINQFTLRADVNTNFWRIESNSETVMTVDGVPLQNYTHRTKKTMNKYPHVLYLEQRVSHEVDIHGLKLTIWLLKAPKESISFDVAPGDLVPVPAIIDEVQNIVGKNEGWAQSRFVFAPDIEQVSRKSFRVFDRFSGTKATAKLFRIERNGLSRRNAEFLKMSKEKLHGSVVQYQQMTEIKGIPSIITSTHEGYASYATCYGQISSMHPGTRFNIAAKLLRRTISAVDFLHFHNIIHGHLSRESILLRFLGDELDGVLVADYSSVQSISSGDEVHRRALTEDGRAVIAIVEECCDIWNLRNGPPPDAVNEDEMRARTATAASEYERVRRIVANFREVEQGDLSSEKGQKLMKLLGKKEQAWSRAQAEQVHNATRRVVLPITTAKLENIMRDWHFGSPSANMHGPPFFVLSLGHQYLDFELVNALYQGRWDTTPREICARLSALEGNCDDPWRTFPVMKTFWFKVQISVRRQHVFIDQQCLARYLAVCAEFYAEHRIAIEMAFEACLQANKNGYCSANQLEQFMDHCSNVMPLPEQIQKLFWALILRDDANDLAIEEKFYVWYHMPSRMFNLTQLQRIADARHVRECVQSGAVNCENFAEIRGEPILQGSYAPMSLLGNFASAFGLAVTEPPDIASSFPLIDPSDFSNVNHKGRIILARTGLVGYASICRTANQISHCPKNISDIASANPFLPTYFGNMKVLPPTPAEGFNYPRPSHWSKFEPAQLQRRRMCVSNESSVLESNPLNATFSIATSVLQQLLADNKTMRDEAIPPPIAPKLSYPFTPLTSFSSSFEMSPSSKHQKMNHPAMVQGDDELPSLSSKLQKIQEESVNLFPPPTAIDLQQSFTIAATSFGFEDDQRIVEQWLEEMTESEDESNSMFGFHIHEGSRLGRNSRIETNAHSEMDDNLSVPDTEIVEWDVVNATGDSREVDHDGDTVMDA